MMMSACQSVGGNRYLQHILLSFQSILICRRRSGAQSLNENAFHMMCDAIRLVEDDVVHTMSMNSSDDDDSFLYWSNGSEQDYNNDSDLSLSSLSSSSSSLSSSSSSSSSSSLSSISNDSMSDERIEGLILMMQQQHQCISVNIHNPNIIWGCQL